MRQRTSTLEPSDSSPCLESFLITYIVSAFSCVAAALMLMAPTSARANWYEVSSDHFIIYADAQKEEVVRFAEDLERFHSLMEHSTGRELAKPGPSNRITVFAAGSEKRVRALAGASDVAGFYLPRWQGSVAFVQNVQTKRGRRDLATTILLHEYVHHFFASTDRFTMPLWMNEGAAEFFSNVAFYPDGSAIAGLRPAHRSFTTVWLEHERTPVTELLAINWQNLSARNAAAKDSFYSNSWLLYHYLATTEDRSGQLRGYWLEVLKGAPSLAAAQGVFGDLGPLQRQIVSHYKNKNRPTFRIEADQLPVGPYSVRALNEGEVASVATRMRLERGIPPDEAKNAAARLRSIATRFPGNASVMALLAQAEYAAGRDMMAIAAADRAIKLDATAVDAYVYKGSAAFRQARLLADPAKKAAAYRRAMEPFEALQQIDNKHIAPLIYTYRSYLERNVAASDDAKTALVRAAQLAPFDQELWLITGMMHINDGRIGAARDALAPLATNPHGGEKSEQVKALLNFLADKPEGQAIPLQEAISGYFLSE